MKFSEELKLYKANHRLTQSKMASVMGISLRMYQYYERGDYDGSDANLEYYRARLKKEATKSESLSQENREDKPPETVGELLTTYAKLVKLHNANANYIFTGTGNKFRSTESGQVAQLPIVKAVKKKAAKKKAAKKK
jgi:transcriptional regulator with XRE-family HTH domain